MCRIKSLIEAPGGKYRIAWEAGRPPWRDGYHPGLRRLVQASAGRFRSCGRRSPEAAGQISRFFRKLFLFSQVLRRPPAPGESV